MSLKDLTQEKHAQAENTAFMKAVFNRAMPTDVWADWLFQKSLFFGTLEQLADQNKLFDDMPSIRRTFALMEDFKELYTENDLPNALDSVSEYNHYLLSIKEDPDRLMAHIYTWHMGDLFGGQMIKRLVPGSSRHLTFDDVDALKAKIRTKLNDSMGDEANVAFQWAIDMMEAYNGRLG